MTARDKEVENAKASIIVIQCACKILVPCAQVCPLTISLSHTLNRCTRRPCMEADTFSELCCKDRAGERSGILPAQ